MASYSTPGVYYERADVGAPPIAPLRTDVAGFVGIARQGPVHLAVPIDSWRQFQAWFGEFTGAGYLAYGVRAFFECGGVRAWVVRVSSPTVAAAEFVVGTATVPRAWRIAASSPGVWGNDLDARLVATHRAQTRSRPAQSMPEYTTVESVAGFVRGSHVRVPISPALVVYRIVSFVDVVEKRLYWIHPDPRERRPWEQALTGLDLNDALVLESVEYTLLMRRDGRLAARYEDLSLVPEHPRYGPALVPGLPSPPPDERGWSVPLAPPPVAIRDDRDDLASIAVSEPLDVADDFQPLTGGADGLAALSVRDFIGEPWSPFDTDLVNAERRRGLRALERAREVALVAVPDIHIQPVPPPEQRPLPPCEPDPCLPPPPPAPAAPQPRAIGDLPPRFDEDEIFRVQAAMIEHCETCRDRVAILDPPYDMARDPRLGLAGIRAWRRRFDSSFAALYFPWSVVSDPLRLGGSPTRAIPPSGHVTGFIAATDIRVGVHKAPANGPLAWLQALTVPIEDEWHGVLNDSHVNAVRAFRGRGLRIFGARTLATDSDWRFLNVRRLLLMIEEAIMLASQWAVFEPNDATTRARLHLSLTSFLLELWRRGALAGATPQESFFVRCDEETNPPEVRNCGELVAEVGVAAVKPFEFVVLRVGRVQNQFEIYETGTPSGVLA
jgi:phage tail sheath protein FI